MPERNLIGPIPPQANIPLHPTPWTWNSTNVFDANGRDVLTAISSDLSQLVAAIVNEKVSNGQGFRIRY